MGEPGRRRLAEERLAHLERSGEAWALLQEFHLAGGGGGEDAASRWAERVLDLFGLVWFIRSHCQVVALHTQNAGYERLGQRSFYRSSTMWFITVPA